MRRSRVLVAALIAAATVIAGCGADDDPPATTATTGDNPSQPPGAAKGDHWHAAFGVQVCGELLEPVADARRDRTGLHSHRDGLIHLHPFSEQSAGDGATMAAFFDTIAFDVSDDTLTTPDRQLKESEGCGGTAAEIRMLVDGVQWQGDIEAFRPQDGQVIQLIFDVPDAEAIDLPWAETVNSPSDVQALRGGARQPGAAPVAV